MWRSPRNIGLVACLVTVAGCAGATSHPRNPEPSPTDLAAIQAALHRDNSTGAVTTITAEDRGGQHLNLIEELFKGRIAGVQVIGGSVRVRGVAQSLTSRGGQEPLLILDGMPAPGGVLETLRGLNPDEVESIQVLKDVSSTAIYGTRGAGGVILVTLKDD